MQTEINGAALSCIGGSHKDRRSPVGNLMRLNLLELRIREIVVWTCRREMLEVALGNFDRGRSHPVEIAVVRSLHQCACLLNIRRVAVNLPVFERRYGSSLKSKARHEAGQQDTRQYP